MKKPELIEAIMQAAGIEVKKQAATVVDAIFDTITKTLAKGEEVAIPGFGVFKVAKRAARMGVNPKTGEKIQIAASIKPKFRAAKALKEAVK
ncbi:MAG: DNA-binding protein HU [Candidatus Wolfebacteria bacterium GW2011_GWA2_42_10]|uniref:DNA-binding protein HU n=2 Tax=Candidatus Wolfeibacteriota TaxID=1752735 RepID=A0A0G0XKG0_9BACT|nr:MAG: DNA-binding protein HU [Candidatus Wolfebacteria bacterium GW2011_GWB1_41_12]KKS25389.1 MAG: DNA-binding protein HU [Candidatus Wolfebacteria bacterium GW2011_GWA2_42_10]KKT56828.1 MAG: DNA-binding protein HU [Candidatus Wolfebacteria bacterium GW2011_GWA1_44_24]